MRKSCKIISILIAVITCLSMVTSSVTAVFAFELSSSDDAYFREVLEYTNTVGTEGKGLIALAGGSSSGMATADTLFYQLDTDGGSGKVYVFNTIAYDDLSKKKQKAVIQAFEEGFKARPFSVDAQQKVYNALSEVDNAYVSTVVSSLFEGTSGKSMQILMEYADVIQTVIGVLGFALLVMFVLSMFADLIYINVPVIHTAIPPEKRSFASRAARASVVAKYDDTKDNGDANLVYAKKRFVGIIVFGLVFYLLFSGKIGDVIMWIVGAIV